ncbi:Rieske 2Fe-2S domain-containing protein [Nocardia sp. CT2-14]|uniref:Cytochrome bc1 complex Rieske iron-sulfur subunit n=2 Tax=Nocardia aurantiaca TaxID=2675850 RepID=A0A6I3KWJ8_9NOCA|nr:Rieske 2Fe-2S domain-containing protein [Nocardia aurantiaca]
MDRRTALATTAVAATALTVAGCSSTSNQPASAAPDTTPAKHDSNPAKKQDVLANTGDVPVGGGVITGDTVITQPTAGSFEAFSSTCTHLGCKVNAVTDGLIKCPCHGSTFHLDGTVASGPAPRALDSKAIRVDGDQIVSA